MTEPDPPAPETPGPPPAAAPPRPSSDAPGDAPVALPGARTVIGTSLELALRDNDTLRTTSLAIGFQFLAAVGPLVLLLLVLEDRAPDLLESISAGAAGRAPTDQETALAFALSIAGLVAVLALAALSVESRILGAGLIGSRAAGRPIGPHEALRRSRQVFWRVVGATVAIQIPLGVLSGLVSTVVEGFTGPSEATLVVSTVVTVLASVPFAYVLAGIVLGGAPIMVAFRRSFAMAKLRWRLALVVAIAETLAQTLLILGLFAALDVVAQVAQTLGLGLTSGTVTTYLTLVVSMLVVTAVGSLLFTVSALAVAPQMVAFVGLTGYAGGLDAARDGTTGPRVRWLSIPMAVGAAMAIIASLSGVASILRG